MKIFSVYDSKAEAYLQPFFKRQKGEALRAFINTVHDERTDLSMWPADYTLFEIGEYDERSGKLINHEVNLSLGCAIEFIDQGEDLNEISNVSPVQQGSDSGHTEKSV